MLPIVFSLLALIFLYIGVSQMLYLGHRHFSWYNTYLGIIEVVTSLVTCWYARSSRFEDSLLGVSTGLVVVATVASVSLLPLAAAVPSATIATAASHAMRIITLSAVCLFLHGQKTNGYAALGLVECLAKAPTLISVCITLMVFTTRDVLTAGIVISGVCLYATILTLYAIVHVSWRDTKQAEQRIRELSEQRRIDIESLAKQLTDQACDRLATRFRLSQREHEILVHLVQHESLGEIAEKLVLSVNTVKTHTRSIYTKMDIHSKSELLTMFHTTRQEAMLEMSADEAGLTGDEAEHPEGGAELPKEARGKPQANPRRDGSFIGKAEPSKDA